MWGPPVLEIDTLRPKNWLGGSILSFYLCHHWFQVYEDAPMYYVDINYVKAHVTDHSMPSDIQIAYYRKSSPIRVFTRRPLVFVIHYMDHYFAVVFDYQKSEAFIFSSTTTLSGLYKGKTLWRGWNGPELWNILAHYHGWTAPEPNSVTVLARQWHQVDTLRSVQLLIARFTATYSESHRLRCNYFFCRCCVIAGWSDIQ